MKKIYHFLFATALLLLALVSCKQETLTLSPDASTWQSQTRAAIEDLNVNSMKVLSSTESSFILELDVNSYAKHAVLIDGKEFFAITAPNAHSLSQKGNPLLPEFSYSIAIPQTAACDIHILNAEYEEINLSVAPSKGHVSSKIDLSTVPFTFSDVYEKDAFYPSKLASTDAPFLMRDVRGSIIRVHPFQYNPVAGVLRVYKKMQVEVAFMGTDNRNVLTSSVRHLVDETSENFFRKQFINYDLMATSSINNVLSNITGQDNGEKGAPPTPPIPQVPSEKMLIICCDSFAANMTSFITHKNSRGITTRLVTMSDVGTTAESVASCIQDDYDLNENLTYVLLVGDVTRVPTNLREDENKYLLGGSDLSYALVSGGDSVPDIYVGRFSARNRNEVMTMVARTINYELNLETSLSWHHRSIGIASGETCWYTPNCLSDIEYMDSIRGMLLNSVYGIGGVAQLYNSSTNPNSNPTTSDILSAINQGVFLINYIGDSSLPVSSNNNNVIPSWLVGNFTLNDIALLENDYKLPFIYSLGAGLGDFVGNYANLPPPCFAESWLTACNSTSGAATGAIGFYGSSTDPFWIEAIRGDIAFNDMLVNEEANTFGELCYGSSIRMLTEIEETQKFLILFWNLFGDPSLAVIPNNYVSPD